MSQVQLFVNILISVITTGLMAVGIILTINKNKNDDKESLVKDLDEKRARIYSRFDEFKSKYDKDMSDMRGFIADHYVETKVCKVVHDSTDRIFTEVKEDIKNIFKILQSMSERLSGK